MVCRLCQKRRAHLHNKSRDEPDGTQQVSNTVMKKLLKALRDNVSFAGCAVHYTDKQPDACGIQRCVYTQLNGQAMVTGACSWYGR